MGLRLKFNLMLVIPFLIGLTLAGVVFDNILQRHARAEITENARLMLASALAIRNYTVQEIRPLLVKGMKREFLPQSVPAYGATKNFEQLAKDYPEYSYKEATLNPTNPRNRAVDWETDIISWFKDKPDEAEFVGTRETATGPSLYISRPIRITKPGCLACHTDPDSAPPTLVKKYGRANGFGWQMNEVVGAQIVSVPMSLPLERARTVLVTFMVSLVGIFLVVALLLNIMLHAFVIKRVRGMAIIANQTSMGKPAPEFKVTGKDEISVLATCFNRMRRSLENAMKMLDKQ